MEKCYTGIEVPPTTVEPCGGVYSSTDCIATPNAITYLEIAAGDSQTAVNASIASALQAKDQQLAELPVPDGSETKLTASTNVTITGSGTTLDPYVIATTSIQPVDSRPYKVFTGHISQEGTSAPFVFSTSENTITGLSFSYFGEGYFGIDLDNPSGKRLWVTVGILPNAGGFASTYQDDPSVKIILAVRRYTGEYANSALNKTPIEIRVYN
jgi:hypothetical protein